MIRSRRLFGVVCVLVLAIAVPGATAIRTTTFYGCTFTVESSHDNLYVFTLTEEEDPGCYTGDNVIAAGKWIYQNEEYSFQTPSEPNAVIGRIPKVVVSYYYGRGKARTAAYYGWSPFTAWQGES